MTIDTTVASTIFNTHNLEITLHCSFDKIGQQIKRSHEYARSCAQGRCGGAFNTCRRVSISCGCRCQPVAIGASGACVLWFGSTALVVIGASVIRETHPFHRAALSHTQHSLSVCLSRTHTTQPAGGVSAGQRFSATVISEANCGSHNIPMGRWRDGICDCCTFGCCHAHCCLACWCRPCALGQVMSRMKLNPCAWTQSSAGMSAFKTLFILAVAFWVVSSALGIAVESGTDRTTTTDPYTGKRTVNSTYESWVLGVNTARWIVWIVYFVFFLIVATLTRAYIRRKYSIPTGCCGPCDDFCCSFWCGTCSVCQMARHTADYANYPASCCTETGLLNGASEVV
jgi:Cys-rich protein (TIGR01571 family)